MKAKYQPLGFLAIAILLFFFLDSYSQNRNIYSSKTIALRITVSDGTWVKASVAEGGMLTIRDEKAGELFAFLPIISNSESNIITLVIYRAINTKSGHNLLQIDSQKMTLHSSKILTSYSFNVTLEAVGRPTSNKTCISSGLLADEKKPSSNCCITCNGRIYCSNCSVSTSCGCCSTADCPNDCN
jgi:hypothetical protein